MPLDEVTGKKFQSQWGERGFTGRRTAIPDRTNVRLLPVVDIHLDNRKANGMSSAHATWWSKAIAILIMAIVAALWIYNSVYAPLVAGRWLWVATFIAVTLFWMALRRAAEHKADSIDYRRNSG